MKLFLSALVALIAWAILTHVPGVPPVAVGVGVLFGAIVGYVSG